jgi:DNA-binding CsgD family transcriptional regulator/tetratricopeptide (TPR) repeat protein
VSQSAGGGALLLERSAQGQALDESFARVKAGEGRLVLVSGEAGIGKSVLVRRFCDAHATQARVLWGGCDALQTPRPLGPLVDMAGSAQGPLLASVRASEKPYSVFVALTEELRAQLTIAVIEDVHWADEATLDILRLLARRAESLRTLVVVTYRDDELEAMHPLRLAVGELGGAAGVVRLRLPPLSRDAVEELARPHGVDGEELYVKTAGNPFFVAEVLAGSDTAIPPTVRDAVLARVSRLGDPARGVLEAVAIVTPDVDTWLLGKVVPEDMEYLDACLAAGILRGEGRVVSFRHELARLAVEQSIGPRRRELLHGRVLEALRNPPHGTPDAALLAHHAEAAGDAVAVLEFATVAGERAASLGAHREAAAQYARALRYAGGLGSAELAGLLQRSAHECYLTDQTDDAVAALQRALACYRELGDRYSEGAALCSLAGILWCPGRTAESAEAAEEAIATLEGLARGRGLALAYLTLAELLDWEDGRRAVAWAMRAVELGEQLGETEVVLRSRAVIEIVGYRGRVSGSAVRLEQLLESAERAGLEASAARIRMNLAVLAINQYSYADVDRHIEAGLAYCGERDIEIYGRYLHSCRARVALDRGRWDEAMEAASFALHDPGPSVVPRIWSLVVLALARLRQGDPTFEEPLDRAAILAERQGQSVALVPVAVARAEAAWLEGRHDDVLEATGAALERAVAQRAWRQIGELSRWRWRVGVRDHPAGAGGPDVATLAGDWQEAARHWCAYGCPYEAALALCDADDDDALKHAHAELQRLGARPAAAIVMQRLRDRGVRSLPRGPNTAARQNPAGLTARELEVLALVAEGLRNAQIAERLVVSPRTVDHQVSAVLRKLGAQTRGEAAAIAMREGIAEKSQKS